MAYELAHGTVIEHRRKVIHVVRVLGEDLGAWEIEEIAEKMRERMLSKYGEQIADVVVMQGAARESFRLSGDSHAVAKVRAALFSAAIDWSPLRLD